MQIEDIVLCEGVQRGLETPAYCSGRYAPTVEKAMHHFHRLLHYILKEWFLVIIYCRQSGPKWFLVSCIFRCLVCLLKLWFKALRKRVPSSLGTRQWPVFHFVSQYVFIQLPTSTPLCYRGICTVKNTSGVLSHTSGVRPSRRTEKRLPATRIRHLWCIKNCTLELKRCRDYFEIIFKLGISLSAFNFQRQETKWSQ